MKLTLKKISPILCKSLGMPSALLEDCFMPATEDDFEEIVNLRKVLFQDGYRWDDSKYLRWRFDFSEPDNINKNHIWVFKYNKEILGIVGATHIDLQIKGVSQSAHHATDILVRPDYKGSGLGGWLALALTEKMPILIATGANENSRSMMSRLYHPVPRWQVWKLPISFSVLINKVWPGIPPYISDILSMPFDILLKFRLILKAVKKPKGFNIRVIDKIPSDVNTFESNDNDIHIKRTQQFLNWRYIENPRIIFTILGMYIADELIGISVSRIYTAQPGEQKHACIFEWVEKNEKYNQMIIHATNEYLVSEGVKLIHAIAYGYKAKQDFSMLGFFEREEQDCIYVLSSDESIQLQLIDANDWVLTAGDSDSDLF